MGIFIRKTNSIIDDKRRCPYYENDFPTKKETESKSSWL